MIRTFYLLLIQVDLYIIKKMSWQISCGFKNLDKLGVRINKIKNTLLVGFFKNQSKSNIFIKEIICKFYREFILKGILEYFFSRSDHFIKDFSCKFKAISIFWWNCFLVPFSFKGISFLKLKNSKVYPRFQKGKFTIQYLDSKVFPRFQKGQFCSFYTTCHWLLLL